MTALAGWQNFYVIVGSSAGALIGLQFVVLTLIADMPFEQNAAEAGHAFSSPTIVYFGTVLLLAGVLTVPWQGTPGPAVLCGLTGLVGVIYALTVARRLRLQTLYQPVFEDWLFHAVLPLVAYATVTISGFEAFSHLHEALFGVGAAALLLLFIGIHNAWDSVTYHVFHMKPKQHDPETHL